jgi:hypothetical protein
VELLGAHAAPDRRGASPARSLDSAAYLRGSLTPARVGTVTATAIVEASGLVASGREADVFWINNDSGDRARLYAVRKTGELIASVDVRGASADDWEAIATGPSASGAPALFIGDIGDNEAARANVTVYVVPEPALAPAPTSVTVEARHVFRYDDGPHNAEALLVDPSSGEITIVTKSSDGRSGIYVGRGATLVRAGELLFGQGALGLDRLVTDGAVSKGGDLIALRTPHSAFLWHRAPGSTIAESLLTPPCPLVVAAEPQGEAIAFSLDGAEYFTTSEGATPPIFGSVLR